MLSEKEIKTKEKDFKGWARNDAKYFLYNENRNNETITEYFNRIISNYSVERLVSQFNYSEKQADYMINFFNTSFWRGYEYWNSRKEIENAKMKEYEPIFKEAEKIAEKVDVSDIQDGFPCGSAHLYLSPNSNSELEKLLKSKNCSYDSLPFSLKLPIKMPSYGQCISFDERICREVKEFLETKGIIACVHTWID